MQVLQCEYVSVLFCFHCDHSEWFLAERFTFEVDSIHEHKHNVMWNTFQEVGDVTFSDILHPLVDLFHRDQGDRP